MCTCTSTCSYFYNTFIMLLCWSGRLEVHRKHTLIPTENICKQLQQALYFLGKKYTRAGFLTAYSNVCRSFWQPVVLLMLFEAKKKRASSSGRAVMMTGQLAWLISFQRALENKNVAGWTSLCAECFCIIDWELMAEAAVIKRVRDDSRKP